MPYAVSNKHAQNADMVRLLATAQEGKQECLMSWMSCLSNHSSVPNISTQTDRHDFKLT
jgi:hypothetical protein